jgi:hypothetical protein
MSDTDVPLDLSVPLDVYLMLLDAARDRGEGIDDVAVSVLEEWAYAYAPAEKEEADR